MQVPFQSQGWFMFTKSKCSFCTKAKAMLPEAKTVNCDTYIAKNRAGFLQYVDSVSGQRPRTFPMIFFDGRFMGGYTSTKRYVDNMQDFHFENF